MHCPSCSDYLRREKTDAGIFWRCPTCEGRAFSVAMARKVLDRDLVNQLWLRSSDSGIKNRKCPLCDHSMIEVSASPTEHSCYIDVCRTCHYFWFDTHELADLAQSAPVDPQDLDPEYVQKTQLSPKAREMLALFEVERIRRRSEMEEDMTGSNEVPDSWWKMICSVLGMPVEKEVRPLSRAPLFTWALALSMAVVYFVSLQDPDGAIEKWGFIPGEMWRALGATWVTSLFLHGGLGHLFSNAYFLLIFGDNVEDFLGKLRFLLLFFCAGIAGCACHLWGDPRSDMPLVGASGAIAGVITFYGFKFTRARLTLFIFWRWITFPAWFALLLWVALQCFTVIQQVEGFTNVSGLAHLGGAAVGLVFWLVMLMFERAEEQEGQY